MLADIVMDDGTELKGVYLFSEKGLGSQVASEMEAVEVIDGGETPIIFFIGEYMQGEIITKKIASYSLYAKDKELLSKLHDFVKNTDTIFDTNDTAEYIFYNRVAILEIIK